MLGWGEVVFFLPITPCVSSLQQLNQTSMWGPFQVGTSPEKSTSSVFTSIAWGVGVPHSGGMMGFSIHSLDRKDIPMHVGWGESLPFSEKHISTII